MEILVLLSLLAASPGARMPVVVELFTSEGCSSCPPADDLLIRLEKEQPVPGANILALSEHVDYWDGIGWRDRFSSPAFTARQQRYAAALHARGAYTPQMVVDGSEEFVGSDPFHAADAVARAARSPKARVGLLCHGASLRIEVDSLPAGVQDAAVLLALTESGLSSDVRSGENRGRLMRHAQVVRSLESAGRISKGRFSGEHRLHPAAWANPAALSAVALVQEIRTMRIVGAAGVPLRDCLLK